jgi:thiamine-monophosphate kinase
MKVRELGEFALIDFIAGVLGRPVREDLVLGIGDDASAWRPQGLLEVGTIDAMVEGVHFTFEHTTWRDLGWKCLAINVSDIAAMGARPRFALVSLNLPGETEVESVGDLYRGMLELAGPSDVDICGGNVSSAPVVMVDVVVIGEAPGKLLERSTALPGELIAVTGYLGQAAAGLRMLKSGRTASEETSAALRRAHLRPHPRIAEGRVLVEEGVGAAIDVSDGLLGDLGHITRASGVGARLSASDLPVHPAVKAAFPGDSLALALSGGEDYELLFTASPDAVERVRKRVSCPVTVIGEVTRGDPGEVMVVGEDGNALQPGRFGWEHFRSP